MVVFSDQEKPVQGELGWKIRDNLEMCELNDLRAVVER
jgi:hypothetical protein